MVAFWYLSHKFGMRMAAIVAVTTIMFFSASVYEISRKDENNRRYNESGKQKSEQLYESMGCWSTVCYFNRLKYEKDRYSHLVKRHLDSTHDLRVHGVVTDAGQDLALDIGHAAACLLAAFQIINGHHGVGDMSALLAYWVELTSKFAYRSNLPPQPWISFSTRAFDQLSVAGKQHSCCLLFYSTRDCPTIDWKPVNPSADSISWLTRLQSRLQYELTAAEELLELFKTSPSVRDGDSAFVAGRGQLLFENISFSYDNTRPVLENINFAIKPGQKVALVVRIARVPVFVSLELVSILGVGTADFLSLKVFSRKEKLIPFS